MSNKYKNNFDQYKSSNDNDDSDTEDELMENDKKRQKINNDFEKDYDEDLQNAIKLSLESPPLTNNNNEKPTTTTTTTTTTSSTSTTKPSNNINNNNNNNYRGSKNNEIIIIDDDDTDDEELQKAIQLSLETGTISTSKPITQTTTTNTQLIKKLTTTTTTTTTTSPPYSTTNTTTTTTPLNNSNNYNSKFKSDTFYLNTIKNQPRFTNVDTISFQDLISKKEMKSAMICGFVLEEDWIFKSIYTTQGRRVPITFVKHYEIKEEKKGTYQLNNTTMVIHPPLLNYQIFHAKLMLFLYNDLIRIVIPSSNPTEHDYLNLGQTIWYQDFYKKSTTTTTDSSSNENNNNEFLNNLKHFLKSIGVNSVSFLDEYDYSTCKIKLITSVPGTYYSSNNKKLQAGSGIYMVQHYLNQYYKNQQQQGDEDDSDSIKYKRDCYYQASSLGGDKTDFRNAFVRHLFLNGEKSKSTSNIISNKPLHIVFPTNQWVTSNRERLINSGCVFLSNKNYNNDNSCFSHFSSKYNYRKELIHHSKIMVGTTTTVKDSGDDSSSNDKLKYDWVYTGSHNFSLSAWGAFQKNETQISISNFEIGILITNSNSSLNDLTTQPDWSKHIPFNLPTLFYKSNELPFIQENLNLN